MDVYGIDFTSVPSGAKPLVHAVCRLSSGLLEVDEMRRLRAFTDLEELLNQPGPWIAALDFPFGQPRKLIENLNWPLSWNGYVQVVESMTRKEFEVFFREYQDGRPRGDKRHFRAVDRLAGSCSPMQLDFIPVAKMFYEGAKRLLRSKANVVPFDWKDDNAGIVVEGYPALVARHWIGKARYKTDDRRKRTPEMEENRRRLVEGIQHSRSIHVYGFAVRLDCCFAQGCVEDGTGDELDAVLCAIQAGWAYLRELDNYGVPVGSDQLEGWIADPSLRSMP